MAEEMKVMIPEQLDRLAERRARKAAVARRYRAKRRAARGPVEKKPVEKKAAFRREPEPDPILAALSSGIDLDIDELLEAADRVIESLLAIRNRNHSNKPGSGRGDGDDT